MNKIPLPTIGEILREEFLEPLNLSAYAVAKGIDVPTSRIQDLLHDRRKITVDTSVRLGRFFLVCQIVTFSICKMISIFVKLKKPIITIKSKNIN